MKGESRSPPSYDELVRELRLLRERGLTQARRLQLEALRDAAGSAGLGGSDGVVGQAALERLLREAVVRLGGGELGEAAEYTFGLAQGTRGWSPQERRKKAARAYGLSVERFRKAYEPVIVEQVAEEILAAVDRARSSGVAEAASHDLSLRRPGWLLPIHTIGDDELWDELTGVLVSGGPRLVVLLGPHDAGKSTVVRAVHSALTEAGDERSACVRMSDLTAAGVLEILAADPRLVIVDDTDLVPDGQSSLRQMFFFLNRHLSRLLAGSRQVVLVVESDWARRFADSYRLTVPAAARLACPEVSVVIETIRPYRPDELAEILHELDFPGDEIDHTIPYYPGTVAIMAALWSANKSNGPPSHAELMVLQFRRWIDRAESDHESAVRRRLLSVMGRRTLEHGGRPVGISEISFGMGEFAQPLELAEIVSGPLAIGGGRVSFASPFEADVAAAEALLEIATGADRERLSRPVPRRVVELAAQLARERDPALVREMYEKLAELRGGDYERVGYDACTVATILMHIDPSADLDLSRLCLQGPPHETATPVLSEIQGYLQHALVKVMQPRVHQLIELLEAAAESHASCYRDDPMLWRIARRWAYDLPIRPTLERYALELSPLRSWRYEDVLDVSVTGASTVLLGENDRAVRLAIRLAYADPAEVLADIWDGLNDGCWDQVTADREEHVDAFGVGSDFTGVLNLRGSSLQRARFGRAVVAGWDFSGCELLLADMRSCRSVGEAQFGGGNWWSVMLNPADRYRLSPGEESPGFLEWCVGPPWVNPYYSGPWPHPFGVRHVATGR